MPLVYDNRNIREVWYGGRRIRRVYAGSRLVYDRDAAPNRMWNNVMLPYFLLRGKLFYDGGGSPVQVTGYDDWTDVGLRADGSLWALDGASAVRVGEETGFSAVYGVNVGGDLEIVTLRNGGIFYWRDGELRQIGENFTKLHTALVAERDGQLYRYWQSEWRSIGPVGEWNMGRIIPFTLLGERAPAINAGALYSGDGNLIDNGGTWTAVDGVCSAGGYVDFLGTKIRRYVAFALAIRDGDLYAIGVSSPTLLDDGGNWSAVSGTVGSGFYGYALRTDGSLYAVGHASGFTLTRVGTGRGWTAVRGMSYRGQYNAYALRSPGNRLYRLTEALATLIG